LSPDATRIIFLLKTRGVRESGKRRVDRGAERFLAVAKAADGLKKTP
jgi:hypothetical protein